MSIWQFLGLVVVLLAGYYVYKDWWMKQDRDSWIQRLNNNAYQSQDEMDSGKEKTSKPANSTWP